MSDNLKDILSEKADSTFPLKASIDEEPTSMEEFSKPEKITDPSGREILVFKDPLYSREKRSIVNYTMFKGKWEFENLDDIDDNEPEKCAVSFVPMSETGKFTIVFKSQKDRLEFMDSIYAESEMKQQGTGMNLEKFANSKVVKTTGGLIGLSLAGYGLYKLFGNKKE